MKLNIGKSLLSYNMEFSGLSAGTPVAIAGSKIVPIEGMHFTINASMMDNLNATTGKKVSISLDVGKTLTGIVKSVGQHFVHLEKIERNFT